MSEVMIYGASDDLIEVEGALVAEFNAFDEDEGVYLAFSDGTMLRVVYDDGGVWRITPHVSGRASYFKVEAPGDDENNYSDRVTLTLAPHVTDEEFRWVALSAHTELAHGVQVNA